MTKVIHTGDTHIGYRQYHSPVRRADFLDAFRRVVEDALAADVDAVVHAGDLFHDRTPGLEDLMGTIEVLRPLADQGVPLLAVVGNHEGTRRAQWLDLFETLGLAERLDSEGRRVGDTVFYGLDYVPQSKRDALDYEFAPVDAAHAALVSHGAFAPFAHGDWDLEAVLAESTVDFDAVLLGDDHAHDVVRLDGTWATYCGSTERASASERDARGYNVVSFDADAGDGTEPAATGAGVDIRRRGLDTREFVFVDLDLAPGEGTERVRERLREEDLTDAVAVVTLTGDGEAVTPADVERVGEEDGALLTRVNDRRELAAPEADPEVSFADPDEAVRERVRELGLSEAARGIDETVRTDEVADANVRDEVERRVRDLVDEGDLDALRDADDGEPTDDATIGPDGDAADADRSDAGHDDSAGTDGEGATGEHDRDATAEESQANGEPSGATAGQTESDGATDGERTERDPDATTETTMEDYL